MDKETTPKRKVSLCFYLLIKFATMISTYLTISSQFL